MSVKGGLIESPESSEEQGTDSGADGETKPSGTSPDEAQQTPVKRGRGRPRKYPKVPVGLCCYHELLGTKSTRNVLLVVTGLTFSVSIA